MYHLYGMAGLTLDQMSDHYLYADNFVRDVINSNVQMAADSIVALNMWMYATHILRNGVLLCEERTRADNPHVIDLKGGGMDEFIALWVGLDQTPRSEDGHGLYAWAQLNGERFGTNRPESLVNSRLRILYQEGVTALSLPGACTKENPKTAEQLHSVVERMISQMVQPLFQSLLHALTTTDLPSVRLYSMALIPQLSQCRPSIFKRLRDHLLNTNINFDRTDGILEDLQTMYTCFGFTCEDIGSFDDPRFPCEKNEKVDLAGFETSTDVSALSRFDLDVYQLRLLMKFELFEHSRISYFYGSHVLKPRDSQNDPFELQSLHRLGVSAGRNTAEPIFSQFISYFNERDFADKAIIEALDGTSKFTSPSQRAEVVALTSAFQIVLLESIGRLQASISACNSADPVLGFSGPVNPIDEAAALLIGSMEGEESGGSVDNDDGQLIWGLANRLAFRFGRMNEDKYAETNSQILNMLYAAKGELASAACERLQLSIAELRMFLFVALMQSIIRAAMLSEALLSSSGDKSLAEGEVYTLSVLPIIAAADSNAAKTLSDNMLVVDGTDTVRDGTQAVAQTLGAVLSNYLDLPCYHLGSTANIDPCPTSASSQSLPLRGMLLTTSLLAASLVT